MIKLVRNCIIVFSLCLVLLSWSGCGSAPITIQVTDQVGRVVELTKTPEKIATLDPGSTEILYALGLGSKVVGVGTGSDYPMEAQSKPVVGTTSSVDMDTLNKLHPDLVVAVAYSHGAFLSQLEQKKIPVFILAPQNLDGVLDGISLVGEITQSQSAASELVNGLRARIKAVTDKTDAIPEDERPSVFYLVYVNPLMTAGADTFENELIEKAGGTNIASYLEGYTGMGIATIINAKPQVMIGMFLLSVSLDTSTYDFLNTDSSLAETPARESGRVWAVVDKIVNRVGPRLVDGLEEMKLLIDTIPAPNPSPTPSQ